MRRVRSPGASGIVSEAQASEVITNPFDFGEAGASIISARQNARRRARPFSAGLIIARLFCGLLGLVVGMLATEALIIHCVGLSSEFMQYRSLRPVGGMFVGSLLMAVPGFFQSKRRTTS